MTLLAMAELRLICSVSDVSQTGARVALDDPSLLPDRLILDVNQTIRRWCRVLWRSEMHVGVRFINDPI